MLRMRCACVQWVGVLDGEIVGGFNGATCAVEGVDRRLLLKRGRGG